MDTSYPWVRRTNGHRAKIYHEEWVADYENQERVLS